jgi:hypothetical protein
MEPEYTMVPGIPSRACAIAAAGRVLSQPTMVTSASNMWPRPTSSMESAITSLLTRLVFIPCVPMVMPSEMAMVFNSIGVPPASLMPSLTFSAR